MSAREYEDLLHKATEAAVTGLFRLPLQAKAVGDLPMNSGLGRAYTELVTAVVENIIEAATARVFLRLEVEGAKRRRLEAVEVLGDHLCGECLELLAPAPTTEPAEYVGVGDPMEPGSCELAERALFLGWAERISKLDLGDRCLIGTDSNPTPRGQLIWELHASVGQRHPLGIAETLYHIICSLHIGDDRDAVTALHDLAAAEFGAALNEKGAACLAALKTLIDPELDEVKARGIIDDWNPDELDEVLKWASKACREEALALADVYNRISLSKPPRPPVERTPAPAVVHALARKLGWPGSLT